MEMVDSYLDLGLIGVLILLVRLLIMPLTIYNLLWSLKGFWHTVKGDVTPSELYKSVIFYFSAATIAFQVMAYHGMSMVQYSPIVSLTFQCFLMMGTIMATVGRRLTVGGQRWEKFYWLMNGKNLDIATRSVSLHMLDSDFMERRLSTAEEEVNSRMTRVE